MSPLYQPFLPCSVIFFTFIPALFFSVVSHVALITGWFWFWYLTHLPLPFFLAESGSPQFLVPWLQQLRQVEWPFRTLFRPLTTTRLEKEPVIRRSHLSEWQQTGSISCITWQSFPAPCTHSPLTPCGATPPLTSWPVATSLASLEQTFLKRWLHCVSNTNHLYSSGFTHNCRS